MNQVSYTIPEIKCIELTSKKQSFFDEIKKVLEVELENLKDESTVIFKAKFSSVAKD